MSEEEYHPSLLNVIQQKTLKWIFVGGKGGVGKTTCSCSLAVQLAQVRKSVLIISTDPAHNISDAFAQKFGNNPILVEGFRNLYAMEIDSSLGNEVPASSSVPAGDSNLMGIGRQLMRDVVDGLPGIDEAMSFSQMMKLINSLDFEVIVFDTAPTGHTLRLLQLPSTVDNCLEKFLSLQGSLAPMLNQFNGLFGLGAVSMDETLAKIKETQELARAIKRQFKDPEYTTFVCVCIAEFLSLYETERLIQELEKQNIECHNIVVNQLTYPEQGEDGSFKCKKCQSRYKLQAKYLEQINDLYDDFNVTKLPLLDSEVRGVEEIVKFSRNLVVPYQP